MSDLDHTYCSFCNHVTHNRTEPLHKCEDYLKEKVQLLEARLSHLMDVAGKMAEHIKNCPEIDCFGGDYWKRSMDLNAEWDGIKEKKDA